MMKPTPHLIALTPVEHSVLEYLSEDFSVEQTADLLGISPNTCKRHREKILKKAGKHSILSAYKACLRHGVILPPSVLI
jgi:DNA-binding CsgD family transcriptional regulator